MCIRGRVFILFYFFLSQLKRPCLFLIEIRDGKHVAIAAAAVLLLLNYL